MGDIGHLVAYGEYEKISRRKKEKEIMKKQSEELNQTKTHLFKSQQMYKQL